MKNLKLIILAFISLSILSLTSCSKSSDDEVTPDIPGSGSLTLKVDGTAWSASLAVQALNTSGVLSVTGSDSNAQQMGLTLVGITEAGTYTIGGLGTSHMLRWTEGLGTTDTYVANGVIGSGTVTITELTSSKLKGTFSFTGSNTDQATKRITDGSFNVSF